MNHDAQLARVESSQLVHTLLLIYIAAQFGTAWSTGDVLFALVAGGVVVLGAWLAWKILRVMWRVGTAYGWRWIMGAVVVLAAIIEVWGR